MAIHNKLQYEELEILKRLDTFCHQHDLKYFLYGGTLLGAVRHQGFIPWDDDIDIGMKRSEFNKLDDLLVSGDFDGKDYYYQSNRLEKFYWSEVPKVRTNTIDVKEDVAKTQQGYFGPWVDIFPYDNIPDDQDLRIKQYKKVNRLSKIIEFFLMTKESSSDKGFNKTFKKTIRKINERFYKSYFFIPWIMKLRYKEITKYNDQNTKAMASLTWMGFADFKGFEQFIVERKDIDDLIYLPFEDREYLGFRNYHKILTNYYNDYMVIPDKADQQDHGLIFNEKEQ